MADYQKEAKELLNLVGGKDNIISVAHCVTRMRFVLAKPEIAEVEAIEKLPTAKGTFTQAGQFQVIIGNDVTNYYNDFLKVSGIEALLYLEKRKRWQAPQQLAFKIWRTRLAVC